MKQFCLFASALVVIVLFATGCSLFERATPTPAPREPVGTAVAQTLTAIAQPTQSQTPAGTAAPGTPRGTPVPTESVVPLAFFESPQDNAQFAPGETINVGVTALDNSGIARVEFYADNQLIQTGKPQTPAPTVRVMFAWSSTVVGDHILATLAFDTSNNPSALATVKVNIQSGAPAPVAQILAPTSPQTVQAGVQLTVRGVADAPQGITQVQMFVDDKPYSQTGVEKAHAPFSASFVFVSHSPGAHTITLRALDGQQRVGVSNPLTVNVVDSRAPVVNVSYSTGAILRGTNLVLTVLAADTSGIASVQVWADNVLADTYTVPNPNLQTSLTLQRNWTSNVVGSHSLYVRVTDPLNQTVTSPTTPIIVLAPNQPTPTFTRVPPTFTPRPPATQTPQPQPGPAIQVISPMIGCTVQLPNALHVAIQFNSRVGLRQLTAFAQYEGVMAQTIDTLDAGGQSAYTLNRDWVPSASGVVEIYATAVDANGARTESGHTSCAVESPAPPTLPPTVPPPTAPPSKPSASIVSPALGCRIEQNNSLHVIADFEGEAGLSLVQVFAQYGGVMAQPIYSQDVGGSSTYRAEFDWDASSEGNVQIYATVQDLAGQRGESAHASCQIEAPAPPTIAPMPTEEPPTFAPPPTEEPPTYAPPPTDEPPPTDVPEQPTDEPIPGG